MGLKALVTGGAGFIGSALTERLLASGATVDLVDDLSTGSPGRLAEARRTAERRLRLHQLDVRDPALVDLLGRLQPEVVFHLAGPTSPAASVQNPVEVTETALGGTVGVLEAARCNGVAKVVYLAGACIYGATGDGPVPETHPGVPESPLGAAQRAALIYLASYRELHSLEYTALVASNVYGPGQTAGVVPAVLSALQRGQPVPVYGEGRQTRDFVYVDDVVDALARAAERGDGLVLNVGTGVATTIGHLVALAGRLLAARGEVERRAPRAGDVSQSCLDPGRAAIHLGWSPWTPLAEGLRSVVGVE